MSQQEISAGHAVVTDRSALIPRPHALPSLGRVAAATTAAFRWLTPNGTLVSASGTTTVVPFWKLTAAELALAGLTPKLRVAAVLSVNPTAPVASFSVGLHPLGSVGGSAGLIIYNPANSGAPVTGSAVNFPTPGASSKTPLASGWFALPADDLYALALTTDAQTAASSEVHISARLELVYV